MKKNTRLAVCLISLLSGTGFFYSNAMETSSSSILNQAENDPILFAQNNSTWNLVFEFDNQKGQHQTLIVHPFETIPLAQASKVKNLKYHGGRGASVFSWEPKFGDKLKDNKDIVIVIGIDKWRNWTEEIREYTQEEQLQYKEKKEQPAAQMPLQEKEQVEEKEQLEEQPKKKPQFVTSALKPRVEQLKTLLEEQARTGNKGKVPTGAVPIIRTSESTSSSSQTKSGS